MKTLPELRDVATDQQTAGTTLTLTINRDAASRYGISAATDRRHAVRCVRPAPGRAVFYAAQQLSCDPGGPARTAGQARHAGQDLREIADDRRAGAALGLCEMDHAFRCGRSRSAIRASSRRSPSASTSPRAWRSARRPKRCTGPIAELGAPGDAQFGSFQGTAQAFQQSLGTVPLLILAALVVVYLILGILYESYIHPITILSTLPSAGVGALAIADDVRFRLQPDRPDRHRSS